MAVIDKCLTDRYAIYNGDCLEVLPSVPTGSVGLSIYSPPFSGRGIAGGLYHYSSSERDLSNCKDYAEFMAHYEFVVRELHRVMMPGRSSLVHCMDVPTGNTGDDELTDFPGDIIALHDKLGFGYCGRYHIWKEPLTVRNRTLTKSLAHKSVVDDSSRCSMASADYLLRFKKRGKNQVPIPHPVGLMSYAGAREIPRELLGFRGCTGDQKKNRYSHWIWRQYASAFWDDIRLDRVLPFKPARDGEDEKHVHPLQRDVIERGVTLWSNPGEVVLTPFMGIGSEVFEPVRLGRKGIGIELKPSYYRQAVRNLEEVDVVEDEQGKLWPGATEAEQEAWAE